MSKSIQQIIDEEREKSLLGKVNESRINRAIANKTRSEDVISEEYRKEQLRKKVASEEWLEATRHGIENYWSENSTVESQRRKEQWQDPDYRQALLKKRAEITATDEYKQKLSEGHNRSMTPELRQKFSDASNKVWSDPKIREKASQLMLKKWQDPEFQNKMAQRKSRSGKRLHTPWGEYDSRTLAIAGAKTQGITNPANKIDTGLKTDPDNFYILS